MANKSLNIAMFGHKHVLSREGGIEIVVNELSTRMVAKGNRVICYDRSTHHVSGSILDDRKAVCADLKKIYGAVNLDDAEYALEEFREKWNGKYPNILKSWDKNLTELTAFFEYPQEIRRIIYTTNAVEGYHRMVRKFTKSKSIFPTDDSIRKVIFLSVSEIEKKWNMPVRDWGLAYPQFMIYFEDRLAA